MSNNFIIGVAIKHNDLMICLPKPNRHHNCIAYACDIIGLLPPVGHAGEQGFYLSDGTFLNRIQAKEHAVLVGQIKSSKFKELYSEDLW